MLTSSESTPLLGKPTPADVVAEGPSPNRALTPSQQEEQPGASTVRNFDGDPELMRQLKYILPPLAIGIFLAAADQTMTVASTGKIATDFDALNQAAWISTGSVSAASSRQKIFRSPTVHSYFLTLTSFQPLYGKFSDVFGRKTALLFAYTIFGIGCLLCGLSQNMGQLIAARAFSGIGGSGLTTVVTILFSDIVPLRERGTWQGYINLIFACGAAAGAPLGGLLADSIGWKWSFILQAPLCLIAFLAVALVLSSPKVNNNDWRAKLARLDFLGALLLILAVFSLLLGLDRGSNDSWLSPLALTALCLSLPLFAFFLLCEAKHATEPFAPLRILSSPPLLASFACNFFQFASYLGILFYLPMYYQAVGGLSAAHAGALLIPGVLGGVMGSLTGGKIMEWTGKYYWLTVSSFALYTLTFIPLVLFSGLVSHSTLGLSLGLAACGFTCGLTITSTLIALIATASTADHAVVTACSYLFRSLGSAVGVALAGSVFQQTLKYQLYKSLGSGNKAAEIVWKARESLDFIKTLEPEVRDLVRAGYAVAARNTFALQMVIASGALVSGFFIREANLSR
ncbi:MAG: hypothetical protein M1829_001262 [Trizodia sp. TS-e1964]|nr:MAG: hypothetical protein M1829_001262 [Trizodia sp. TS-e1964]